MLLQRLLTALVLGAAVAGSIFFGPPLAAVLVLASLVLAGAWEWSGLIRGSDREAPSVLKRGAYVVVVGVCMVAAWWVTRWPLGVAVVLAAAGVWWALAATWLVAFSTGAGADSPPPVTPPGVVPRSVIAAAGLLSLVPAWLALAYSHVSAATPWTLVLIVLLVVSADVGAYVVGRLFGRHRLARQVSPGKTWEGLAGGVGASVLVALVAGISGLPVPEGLLAMSVLIALTSVVGDLTVSRFKRNAGLKHSGHLLPGHGGVLDRIDSFCSAAPAYAVWLTLTGP